MLFIAMQQQFFRRQLVHENVLDSVPLHWCCSNVVPCAHEHWKCNFTSLITSCFVKECWTDQSFFFYFNLSKIKNQLLLQNGLFTRISRHCHNVLLCGRFNLWVLSRAYVCSLTFRGLWKKVLNFGRRIKDKTSDNFQILNLRMRIRICWF